MLIGIQGGLGTGKTVLLTKYLITDYYKDYEIYVNYKLYDIKYNDLHVEEMLENEQQHVTLKNATIGIDELTVFADCRLSASKMNRWIGYLVLQSRKRSVDLYYTTQNFSMIDKRILNHTHIQVIAQSLYDREGNVIPHFKKYSVIDARDISSMKINRFILDIRPYYDFYDTDEIIKPPMLK